MAELFAVDFNAGMTISEKTPSELIRTYLKGSNERIKTIEYFKKSTPPAQGSGLINVTHVDDWFMNQFARKVSDNLSLAIVGTYSEAGIASSCYHNNLAILENVLSHTTDHGAVVVDMVAGTDAFASTLFAQFDALFFVAEPTNRSLAVYKQYEKLALKGGVTDRLFVVGNKVEDEEDMAFIKDVVGEKLIATISRSQHVLLVDKAKATIDASSLSVGDVKALQTIKSIATAHTITAQERLPLLWSLHNIYASQPFIKDRLGDLMNQIDRSFVYPGLK